MLNFFFSLIGIASFSSFVSCSPVKLRTGYVTANSTSWTEVDLGIAYDDMAVITTPSYAGTQTPQVQVKVKQTSASQFQVKLLAFGGGFEKHRVHYIVAEVGVYNNVGGDDVDMEVVKIKDVRASRPADFREIEYTYQLNHKTAPVVLGSVMSANDDLPCGFFAVGTSPSRKRLNNNGPYAGPTKSKLFVGMYVSMQTAAKSYETIAFIITPPTKEGNADVLDGRPFIARKGDKVVGGYNGLQGTSAYQPPYYQSSYVYDDLPNKVIDGCILSQVGIVDVRNQTWPLLYGEYAQPFDSQFFFSWIELAIDQYGKGRKLVTFGQIDYFAFGELIPGSIPAPTPPSGPQFTPAPTPVITASPTPVFSGSPTSSPSQNPTDQPSHRPTVQPTTTNAPATAFPSKHPTSEPTSGTPATAFPSKNPTSEPSVRPTARPTSNPTRNPTKRPTVQPTPSPTIRPPTATANPTTRPTVRPTQNPTLNPTLQPVVRPTLNPTPQPAVVTAQPTFKPTAQPFVIFTSEPTPQPPTTTADPGTTAAPLNTAPTTTSRPFFTPSPTRATTLLVTTASASPRTTGTAGTRGSSQHATSTIGDAAAMVRGQQNEESGMGFLPAFVIGAAVALCFICVCFGVFLFLDRRARRLQRESNYDIDIEVVNNAPEEEFNEKSSLILKKAKGAELPPSIAGFVDEKEFDPVDSSPSKKQSRAHTRAAAKEKVPNDSRKARRRRLRQEFTLATKPLERNASNSSMSHSLQSQDGSAATPTADPQLGTAEPFQSPPQTTYETGTSGGPIGYAGLPVHDPLESDDSSSSDELLRVDLSQAVLNMPTWTKEQTVEIVRQDMSQPQAEESEI